MRMCVCVRYNESPVASFASASEFPFGIGAHLRIQGSFLHSENLLFQDFYCSCVHLARYEEVSLMNYKALSNWP